MLMPLNMVCNDLWHIYFLYIQHYMYGHVGEREKQLFILIYFHEIENYDIFYLSVFFA